MDCHPAVAAKVKDPAEPLWISEGIKKCDALVSHGAAALGLPGVWNFKSKENLAQWSHIPLKGRQVCIAYDSDVMTKRPVAQALARLTEFLRLRGATPFVCLLPQTDGHKCGVDDFLAQEHTLQDLERFLRSPDDKGQYAVLPPERQWEAEILRTGTTQAPRTCLGNIELFLVNHPRLKGEWWWNPRTLRPMRGQAVVDATTIDITITGLHRLGMAVHNRDMVEEAIHAVFGRHRPGAVSRKFGTPG